MLVKNLKLDQYDHKFNELEKIAEVDGIQKWLEKGADLTENLDNLDNEDFALILVGDDGVKRSFPIVDPGNAVVSSYYLNKVASFLDSIDPQITKTARAYIGRALEQYGIIKEFDDPGVETNVVDIRGKKVKIAHPVKPEPIEYKDKVASYIKKIAEDDSIPLAKRLKAASTILKALVENPELLEAVKTLFHGTDYLDRLLDMAKATIDKEKLKESIEMLADKFITRMEEMPQPLTILRRIPIEEMDEEELPPIADIVTRLFRELHSTGLAFPPRPTDFIKPKSVVIVIRKRAVQPGVILKKIAENADEIDEVLGKGFSEYIARDPEVINSMDDDLAQVILNILGI